MKPVTDGNTAVKGTVALVTHLEAAERRVSTTETSRPRWTSRGQSRLMDLERLAVLLVGAVFGALGWLVVGVYMQRREHDRQARNAARAVYFELELNALNVKVARDHARFGALNRSTFDRFLPELSTWLSPEQLRAIVQAYHGQAGYEQLSADKEIPAEIRKSVLGALASAHDESLAILGLRAFGKDVEAVPPKLEGRSG